MSNELTYILGAGASFQSIPVVKTFNKRLLKFEKFLQNEGSRFTGDERRKYNEAANSYQRLFHEFSSHHSFDTYFKKLFHLGDFENINNKKRLLNLYFLWEHSQSSLIYNNQDDKESFVKQSLFDRRYDALIAGLLKPVSGKAETLCNVNFVTWNYDINLLNSIKNFFYPKQSYENFLEEISTNEFVWSIGDKIKIININGYFFNSGLNSVVDLTNIHIDSIIQKLIFEDYLEKKSIDENADKIRFAWELSDSDSYSLRDILASRVRNSDNIVIVGYTFPVYNRFVDFSYFGQDTFLKKNVIIQDPNCEDLKRNLQDIFRLGDRGKFQTISNCDNFYLPSSVFGIKEYRPMVSVSATSL